MLHTFYAFAMLGTMALWHIFSAAKTEERKRTTARPPLSEPTSVASRDYIPENLDAAAVPRARQPWEQLLDRTDYHVWNYNLQQPRTMHQTDRSIEFDTAMYRVASNHYNRQQEPMPLAYRRPQSVQQRAASVPRAPLTPAGTLPTNRCTDCSICMDNSNNSLPACRIGMCGHVFHTRCIRPWLAENHTCPNCRAAV